MPMMLRKARPLLLRASKSSKIVDVCREWPGSSLGVSQAATRRATLLGWDIRPYGVCDIARLPLRSGIAQP